MSVKAQALQGEIFVQGHGLPYTLSRTRRKTVGMRVEAEGLFVSAPHWAPLRAVEQILHSKGDWILRKIAEQKERMDRSRHLAIRWTHGSELPFLGRRLVIDAQVSPVGRTAAISASEDVLQVQMPALAGESWVREHIQSWLKERAREVFEARCKHFAPLLGVDCRRLVLSSAKRRWGSASADGSIRLNWRLVHFPEQVIDYVVVHELAHLREMNHSPAFWQLVKAVYPQVEQAKAQLRQAHWLTLA